MNLFAVQRELHKRLAIPYRWPRRQNDGDDQATAFIYHCSTFNQVHVLASSTFGSGSDGYSYALNRWYNFLSAQAVEYIFSQHPRVSAMRDRYHRLVDFRIDGIPFDHKTTVWPKAYPGDFDGTIQQPQPLLHWLYANQSGGQRHHVSNRLFLVLYRDDGEHWRLKADVGLLAARIEEYLNEFDPARLHLIAYGERTAQTDAIWVTEH